MKEYTPKKQPYLDIECPLQNTEWYCCNITGNKCPKQWIDEENEDQFDFPDDCPAKGGVKIFFPEKEK